MIKAVLLDLGNVIVGLDFDRAYRAAALLSPFGVLEIPGKISEAGLSVPYECGQMESEEFHRRFCEALQMEMPFEDFGTLWGDMFQTKPLLSEALVQGLRKQQRLLLLSNTNDLHFRWIRRHYPVLEHFHDFVLSYEVGAMKPDGAIYQEAVRRAGCQPAECFFTDDKAENVEGALRAGIDAELFVDEETLKSQLAGRGIVWDG